MKWQMKNKRGSAWLGIVVALLIWSALVLFLPYITDLIATARVSLTCTSPVSSGVSLMCLGLSGATPYFIILFAGGAIGYLVGKK